MDGGERSAVAGVERLQEVGGLAAPDLADDDVVGPVAERVPDQVTGSTRAPRSPPPRPRSAGSSRARS